MQSLDTASRSPTRTRSGSSQLPLGAPGSGNVYVASALTAARARHHLAPFGHAVAPKGHGPGTS